MISMRHPLRSRRQQRGITLVELAIGVFIATFLTAAAVAFAAHETRLMGVSRDKLNVSQSSRTSLDLLATDLAMAGGGIGFDASGSFTGLDIGQFNIDACAFNATGAETPQDVVSPVPVGAHTVLNLRTVGPQGSRPATYQTQAMDLKVAYTDGAYVTIADHSPGAGQYCRPQPGAGGNIFAANELALMRRPDGVAAYTVNITATNPAGVCTLGQCLNGCDTFAVIPNAAYASDPTAANAFYRTGELRGGYKTVVWFLASNPPDFRCTTGGCDATLRRHVIDGNTPACAARNNTLGGAVASNVEAMRFQVYQYVDDLQVVAVPHWVNQGQGQLDRRFRTRMDMEIVIRASNSSDPQKAPTQLKLQSNACLPSNAGCNALNDSADREVFRTSVEIRNASL